MITKYKIFESPDHSVLYKNNDKIILSVIDKDSYSFVYDVEYNLLLSESGVGHNDNMYNINDEGEITDNTIEINYNSNIPNGRIWIKKKVISFWNFSGSVSIFLFDLKTQLIRHKIVDKTFSFDEEWLVERPITQIDSINTKYEFIPLSKFDGIVGDTKKDYILHNMKADKKRKELIKRGY
jgi:hypothetical protein